MTSPWYFASAALLFFGFAAFGSDNPVPWYGFGTGWLILAILNAAAAPPKAALRERTIQARGMFRIYLLSIALLFFLALSNSSYSINEAVAFGGVMLIFLYFLENQIK